MKLNLKNLGTIKSGCFHANDLTIIFGKNNSGKTYISYVSYILLKKFSQITYKTFIESDVFKKLERSTAFEINIEHFFESKNLKKLNIEVNRIISEGFRVPNKFFENTEVNFDIDEIKANATEKTIDEHIGLAQFSKVGFIKKQKNSTTLLITIVSNDNLEESNLDSNDELADIFNYWFFDTIKRTVISKLFDFEINDPFIITSERTGIEQFYKDLDSNRSSLLEEMAFASSTNKNNLRRIQKDSNLWGIDDKISTYSLPIADNIMHVREASKESRIRVNTKKDLFHFLQETFQKMTQGTFKRNKQGTSIVIADEKNNKLETTIPLQVASSSIKALSLFEIYLNYFFQRGQVLIIDEPELNLHPDNQIHMAELIVRLANSGVKVIITTHSDYIVREINNRIKLNKLYKNEAKSTKFFENKIDVISPEKVNVFNINDKNNIESISVNEHGIETVIFDEIIQKMMIRDEEIEDALYELGTCQ